MSAQPIPIPEPSRPPSLAPLELVRLRGSVRAGLFGDSSPPPRVGRFELTRCIGHGGMGIVYAARDVELGREVAIKLLRPELSRGTDDALTAEARALARLSHPNVIAVFDVGTYEGQRFIAMEYVAGLDLRRWLQAPRSLQEVLRVFVAAGRGLAAAHAVGLVHRDFKPDNVLVGDDGRPRVLDFGLARPPETDDGAGARPPSIPAGVDPLATVLTGAGRVLGTPAYMAPEQYLGEPADARSDQFSFAVALYHAVYGVRPFSGEDPQALALSIVRGRLRPTTPRYPVPPWLERLLVRALSVDPAQRFESMTELLAVMEARLDGADAASLEVLPTRAVVDELEGRGGVHGTGVLLDSDPLRSTGVAELAPRLPIAGAAAGALDGAVDGPVGTRLPAVARGSTSLALPPDEEQGVVTSVSTRRTLPGTVDGSTLKILVRELARLERRRGRLETLGASVAWSTRDLDVHIDATPKGTEILVWRRLNQSLRRRTVGWMALGMWLSSMFIAAVMATEVLFAIEEVIPAFVIGSFIGGAVMGHRKARQRHTRALPAAQDQVEFIADRLVGLARANASWDEQ